MCQIKGLRVHARDVSGRVSGEPLRVFVDEWVPRWRSATPIRLEVLDVPAPRDEVVVQVIELESRDVRGRLVKPRRIRTCVNRRDGCVHGLVVDHPVHQDVEDDVHTALMAAVDDAPQHVFVAPTSTDVVVVMNVVTRVRLLRHDLQAVVSEASNAVQVIQQVLWSRVRLVGPAASKHAETDLHFIEVDVRGPRRRVIGAVDPGCRQHRGHLRKQRVEGSLHEVKHQGTCGERPVLRRDSGDVGRPHGLGPSCGRSECDLSVVGE